MSRVPLTLADVAEAQEWRGPILLSLVDLVRCRCGVTDSTPEVASSRCPSLGEIVDHLHGLGVPGFGCRFWIDPERPDRTVAHE